MNTKTNELSEPSEAFKRFAAWLVEREIDPSIVDKFMFMTEDAENFWFKNRNTRNYIIVNKKPRPFLK